ncbi:aspartate--tRNA(Asp/Asn) ligase [Virgibacillus pantothenticus]|uniref:Aspartate--tRNA ligase n=1 Tax=Virgibacillus pantothenticus TaxID=1473 RepID=A0A0L0QQX0_VIRPA|nr:MULTISPECIES: aspartate--tRNA ligase [Virgibacillus]API90639.1 aspartate--tRNA ligase [Virgibacillus sp. 6R]KNE20593.1 aspartate--tRNA ligase [Virgibacillus pantothenticus]MBS7429758.1 aspartate--tRNA ligase [Virgibacillus sp. 19R1-5]MED3738252.1 aspartate--tRNA ligase [Virgibacillus pantothenticus]QTY17646.1 aspartate--tRNA ligase [Virgibacillus pantothenticus]
MSKHQRIMAGTLSETNVNESVLLKGWVQKRRDLGGLIFIDLRDASGTVQIVFNPDHSQTALEIAETVRSEYVVEVEGTVVKRDASTINPNMKTGEIEVIVSAITVLNKAKTPPFAIQDKAETSEDLRLTYRYLDLRRQPLQDTFKLRHQITQAVRHFLNEQHFLEMETPILTKSTPEGARDYLVPSRVHKGEFYALPQSPQLFKQLIMMGGFEKYYQIARCFRDEDLRADRQPEFTQIDIETSFLTSDEIMQLTEQMMQYVMKEVKGIDISLPLKRMPYEEAMARYGSDKPDTRFGMELIHVADIVKNSNFKVFQSTIESGGLVALLNVKQQATAFSRKDIDKLTEFVKVYGAKGLAWFKVEGAELKGPIAKFISEEEKTALLEAAQAEDGDLLLFVADKTNIVYDSLGALRLKLGKELGLIDQSAFHFLWVTDWPLLEYDEEQGRYFAAHHPFTSPVAADREKLDTEPENVKANAYDLVLNGYELGGGSIRIHQTELQQEMFKVLGFSETDAREQFGFLLEALEYGAPPHGGVALGLDRIVMLLAGRTNLRDTILFPKTASASDLLTNAPSEVDKTQLDELSIQLISHKEDKAADK